MNKSMEKAKITNTHKCHSELNGGIFQKWDALEICARGQSLGLVMIHCSDRSSFDRMAEFVSAVGRQSFGLADEQGERC